MKWGKQLAKVLILTLWAATSAYGQEDGYIVKIPEGKFQKITRTFPANGLDGIPLPPDLLLSSLANEIRKVTKIKNIQMDSGFSNAKGTEGYSINLSTLAFDLNQSTFQVEYLALSNTSKEHFTKLKFETPFQMLRVGDSYELEVMVPESGSVKSRSSLIPWAIKPKLFGEWKLLINNFNEEKHYVIDYYNVYQEIGKASIPLVTRLVSEFNSTFNTNSVKGNFDRKLSKTSVQGSDGEVITAAYKVNIGGFRYPLNARFYPYQNGTKTTYTVDVNYQINADGSFDTPREILEKLKNEVLKIAND